MSDAWSLQSYVGSFLQENLQIVLFVFLMISKQTGQDIIAKGM